MKLVEIKNSLAKLYYEPNDFPLAISDFLTIDDGNQKILSQVVSIESTTKADKNCAVLKFSLDLAQDNTFSAYSGYVPALDSLVSKTNKTIVEKIFNKSGETITLGRLTNETKLVVKLNTDILSKFLYIQSDRLDETDFITQKIINNICKNGEKVFQIETNKSFRNEKAFRVELGKNFKLPINNDTLNYIYENDLAELKIDEKTIVQDIILDIQDYINSLDDKFIPFDTLFDVVNQIYETEKSTGIILFRNKLIKYNQFGIFASKKEDFSCLQEYINNNQYIQFCIDNANDNWKRESINFVINNIKSETHFIMEVDDEVVTKGLLAELYANKNFKPIISSLYNSVFANQLKSYAKDIILFRPEEKQKFFASYNSFMTKLSSNEFIISGESTYYTPLILKPLPDYYEEPEEVETESVIEEPEVELVENGEEVEELEAELVDYGTDEEIINNENTSDSIETEIAKDVDAFFYADTKNLEEEETETEKSQDSVVDEEIVQPEDLDDLLSDDELDLLDEFNEETNENILEENIQDDFIAEETIEEQDDSFNIEDDTIPEITDNKIIQPTQNILEDAGDEDFSSLEEITDFDTTGDEEPLSNLDLIPDFETNDENEESVKNEAISFLTEENSPIPIFSTELDDISPQNEPTKIAEGNIVYHAKYGKGVVEQFMEYGQKTFCLIQFDNVGRRILDPNLAELKQM